MFFFRRHRFDTRRAGEEFNNGAVFELVADLVEELRASSNIVPQHAYTRYKTCSFGQVRID